MSYNLSVSVLGAKELKDAINSVDGVAKKAIMDAMNKTVYKTIEIARPITPHDKGQLRDSLDVAGPNTATKLAQVSGNNIKAVVGTNVKYAHYQEMGGYGKRVVRKYKEPGTDKLFLKRAKDQVRPFFTDYMQAALDKIVKHLSNK